MIIYMWFSLFQSFRKIRDFGVQVAEANWIQILITEVSNRLRFWYAVFIVIYSRIAIYLEQSELNGMLVFHTSLQDEIFFVDFGEYLAFPKFAFLTWIHWRKKKYSCLMTSAELFGKVIILKNVAIFLDISDTYLHKNTYRNRFFLTTLQVWKAR